MSQLDKLRLSLPCFLGVDRRLRAKARRAKPDISGRTGWLRGVGDALLERTVAARARLEKPDRVAHCVGGLTHISRLELFRVLRSAGASGDQWVTRVPERVFGTDHLDEPIPPSLRAEWAEELQRLDLLGTQQPRGRFRQSMCAHKSVLAPTGFGELTFRHAEAWLSGRALICPDVSHAETMYPFRDRHNILFCSPDWSDLPEILTALDRDPELWSSVGRAGRRDWQRWIDNRRQLLMAGIVDHLCEALPSWAT